jgi:hypothetical protein
VKVDWRMTCQEVLAKEAEVAFVEEQDFLEESGIQAWESDREQGSLFAKHRGIRVEWRSSGEEKKQMRQRDVAAEASCVRQKEVSGERY